MYLFKSGLGLGKVIHRGDSGEARLPCDRYIVALLNVSLLIPVLNLHLKSHC